MPFQILKPFLVQSNFEIDFKYVKENVSEWELQESLTTNPRNTQAVNKVECGKYKKGP